MAIDRKLEIRAGALLEHHMNLLGASANDFKKTTAISYDIDKDDLFYRISYNEDGKFLIKTLNMELKILIGNIDIGKDFSAKIGFKGQTRITNAIFKIKNSTKKIDSLLNNETLLNYIIDIAGKVDIAKMKMDYFGRSKTLAIKIYPYGGAMLWLKIPPIYFPIKLHDNEMKALYALMQKVGNYFCDSRE